MEDGGNSAGLPLGTLLVTPSVNLVSRDSPVLTTKSSLGKWPWTMVEDTAIRPSKDLAIQAVFGPSLNQLLGRTVNLQGTGRSDWGFIRSG